MPGRNAEQRPIGRAEHVLDQILRLHTAHDEPTIIDTSGGDLGIWKGAKLRPRTVLDLRERPGIPGALQGTWLDLPRLVAHGSHHAALWDPIHVTGAGSNGRFARYVAEGNPINGDNITHLFQPFLESVRPVLDQQRGTLVVKLVDVNHSGSQQWQAFELWRVAQERGWLACSYVAVPRIAMGPDPKWRRQYSLPNGVTFWLVFHPMAKCPQQAGLPRIRHHRCVVCGTPFLAQPTAKTCSPACRQRAYRQKANPTRRVAPQTASGPKPDR